MRPHRRLAWLRPYAHRVIETAAPLFQAVGGDPGWSPHPISLMVPLHPKDLPIARHCIDAARANVRHPIAETILVGPLDPSILDLCNDKGCRFVDESDALEWTKDEIRNRLAEVGYDYWTWLFQQFLKLGADRFAAAEDILIVDADTLLLRPRVFRLNRTLFQQFSHERNAFYRLSHQRLTNLPLSSPVSYVCHHMYAEARILKALRDRIEQVSGENWMESIIQLADRQKWPLAERASLTFEFFSEYETYGNFCRSFYDEIRLSYFLNRGAYDFRPGEDEIAEFASSLPEPYCWTSFHSYYYQE